jgi:hypothetical protein
MKKVLIIAALLFVVMGIMATAGLIYVGYRVKNRIEKEAASLRHDGSRPAPVTVAAAAEVTGHRVDACSLLTKEEASQILDVAVERTQAKEASGQSTCQYFAKARSQQEKMASLANAFTAIAKGGATPEPQVKANEAYKIGRQSGMDDLVKGIGGLAAPTGAAYLTVTVSWENGRQAMSVLKGVIAGNSAGVQTTESLAGIGDEALVGPVDSFLAFVKGQTEVQIDLSQIPKGRDKGVAIARTIAPRL